jgi:hypothetical protein
VSYAAMTKSSWRYFVKPEILFLVGAVQANLPYLLWQFGYPVSKAYRFDITYMPLCLWFFGYLAFYLGTGFVSFCLCKKVYGCNNVILFRIHQGNYRFCVFSVIVALGLQIYFACRLYGVLPILAFFSGYDVGILNATQESSGFGQLGLLILTCFTLNALVLIGVVSSIKSTGWNRKLLWIAFIVAAFGSLFSGKTQGFFILCCMLFTGAAITGANPVNMLLKRFGFREFSRRRVAIVIGCLLFLLVLLHGFTRHIRSRANDEFTIVSSISSVGDYLAWPLMNMEKQISVSGLSGGQSDASGLLLGILPYKMQKSFMAEHEITPIPRLQKSSPSGFLSKLHWYLGFWGMMVSLFVIGVVCKCIYVQSRKSLFCILAYGQIAWTLIAAHSYNHFLNLMFLPVPIIAFFALATVIGVKRMPGKACARELIWT